MAVMDVVSDLQSVAQNGFLTIQPSGTVEWIVHNIYAEAEAELYRYDGVDSLKIDSSGAGGRWWSNLQLHVNNGQYLRVKQLNATAKVVGYDGVVTRV